MHECNVHEIMPEFIHTGDRRFLILKHFAEKNPKPLT